MDFDGSNSSSSSSTSSSSSQKSSRIRHPKTEPQRATKGTFLRETKKQTKTEPERPGTKADRP